MFARITWSQLPSPGREQLDAGASFYRQRILPSLQTQKGFLGAVVLANADTGEGSSTTYWETAEALAASEAMGAAGRVEAAQAGGIVIKDIDRFELVLQDRTAPPQAGTFVRVNDVQASSAQIDAGVTWMRDTGLPVVKSQNGYRALLVFANRTTGRVLVASVWNSAADRDASEAGISALRTQMVDALKASGVRVSLYEGILAEVSAAAQQATTTGAAAG